MLDMLRPAILSFLTAKEQRCADLRGDTVVAANVGRNVEGVRNIVDAVEAA